MPMTGSNKGDMESPWDDIKEMPTCPLRNVMRKLEASSRAHAVAIALRESAIEL